MLAEVPSRFEPIRAFGRPRYHLGQMPMYLEASMHSNVFQIHLRMSSYSLTEIFTDNI